jgi:hypothetical protein
MMNLLRKWLRRKGCFHHALPTVDGNGDRIAAQSYIKSRLIDTGMRKMFWCNDCGRTWIV